MDKMKADKEVERALEKAGLSMDGLSAMDEIAALLRVAIAKASAVCTEIFSALGCSTCDYFKLPCCDDKPCAQCIKDFIRRTADK